MNIILDNVNDDSNVVGTQICPVGEADGSFTHVYVAPSGSVFFRGATRMHLLGDSVEEGLNSLLTANFWQKPDLLSTG